MEVALVNCEYGLSPAQQGSCFTTQWYAATTLSRAARHTRPRVDRTWAHYKRWCSSVPIVERPMQKSSYVHISYVGASKEMKIVENYEMKLVFLTSPP